MHLITNLIANEEADHQFITEKQYFKLILNFFLKKEVAQKRNFRQKRIKKNKILL